MRKLLLQVFSLWLLCFFPGVTGLRRQSLSAATLLDTDSEPAYFFMAHHKTGTALINHVCDHMKHAVTGRTETCSRCQSIVNSTSNGTWCWHVWSDGITKTRWPEFYNNSEHYFAGTPLEQVEQKAADYRAVHVIRDPLTTFASAYIYDQKGGDHSGAGRAELMQLSLRDGLRLKALDMRGSIAGVLSAHKLAVSDPHVLEVRFEDFRENFTAAVAGIFNFVTQGRQKDLLPLFVKYAQKDDQSRWSATKMNQTHVSNPGLEAQVVAELRQLCAEGDERIKAALEPREAMGYGVPCPGPNDS